MRWLDHILQDAGFAIRIFRKNIGFTVVAVSSLALGIGANTAIFSLMDQIMFRKLAVEKPEELVVVKSPGPTPGRSTSDEDGGPSFSYPMYRELRENNPVFEDMLARFKFSASIAFNGQTERSYGELSTMCRAFRALTPRRWRPCLS
jgi:hypothetical protein